MPLLVAALAAACLLALHPYGRPDAPAVGQRPSPPADAPLALFADGGVPHAIVPRATSEPPVCTSLPQPSDDSVAVPERAAVACLCRDPPVVTAHGDQLASRFAASKLPRGPPILA